jgi:hypothetical protein
MIWNEVEQTMLKVFLGSWQNNVNIKSLYIENSGDNLKKEVESLNGIIKSKDTEVTSRDEEIARLNVSWANKYRILSTVKEDCKVAKYKKWMMK